jgi:hypothetical protein
MIMAAVVPAGGTGFPCGTDVQPSALITEKSVLENVSGVPGLPVPNMSSWVQSAVSPLLTLVLPL